MGGRSGVAVLASLGLVSAISVSSPAAGQCVNDCGGGTTPEGEACIVDGGSDTTNGGCNNSPPVFTSVTCGTVICGTASTFIVNPGGPCDVDADCPDPDRTCAGDPIPGDGNPEGICAEQNRDTDWYRISNADLTTGSGGTGVLTVTATLTSEFDGSLFIIDIEDCALPVVIASASTSIPEPPTTCTPPASAEAFITAADHLAGIVIFVAPQDFGTGVDCGANDGYILDIECVGHPAACDGNSTSPCDAAGPDPGCQDPACCILVCDQQPQCCALPWSEFCAGVAADQCTFLPQPCPPLNDANCQMPDLTGSGGLANRAFLGLGSDQASNAITADNFTPESTGQVTEVCWWGFYSDGSATPDCSLAAVDDFTITYYDDDGNGLPQLPALAVFSNLVPPRVAAGLHDPDPGVVGDELVVSQYSIIHAPVDVVGGQCYWIEIKNNLDGTCVWFWETAPEGDWFEDDFHYSLHDDKTGYDYTDGTDIELGWCIDVVLGDRAICAPPIPQETCDPAGAIVLTQNNDPNTIVPLNSIACVTDSTPQTFTFENSFARSYDLGAIPETAGQTIEVTCVRVAVEDNDGSAYPVTVNVFEDTDGGAPTHPTVDLTVLGSVEVYIPVNTSLGFVEARFDPPVTVPADSLMVVELDQPNRNPDPLAVPPGVGDSGGMWPGTNALGFSASSYIRSGACGFINYVPVTLFDPTSQLLQEVHVNIVPRCPWDCQGTPDGQVNIADFLAILAQWDQTNPPCDDGGSCDIDGNGCVDINDFLAFLGNFGPCP
jgi:hypothetical protein